MYIISKIDYRIYKKFDKIAYLFSALLLLAVLIPAIRWEGGGAARWIYIKPLHLTFQPSEVAKVALVIFFASYLTDNRDKIRKDVGRIFQTANHLSFTNCFNINWSSITP